MVKKTLSIRFTLCKETVTFTLWWDGWAVCLNLKPIGFPQVSVHSVYWLLEILVGETEREYHENMQHNMILSRGTTMVLVWLTLKRS